MDEIQKRTGRRVLLGVIIIALGGLLLLSNLGMFDFSITRVLFSWPVLVILVGAILYINSNDRAGLIIMLVGAVFLVSKFYYNSVWTLWPVLLIVLGVYMLINVRRSPRVDISGRIKDRFSRSGEPYSDDYLDDVSIFSGSKKNITSSNFRGGKITAIFGGSEIDLGDSTLAPGENVLDVLTIFGGAEIYVPKDWKVIIDITPVFGGFSDDRRRNPNQVYDPDRTLIIRGTAIFGGGEIKNA